MEVTGDEKTRLFWRSRHLDGFGQRLTLRADLDVEENLRSNAT
jgi:hypothetical protein